MNYEAAELEIKTRLENASGSPAGLPDKYRIYILPDNDEEFQDMLPQGNEVAIGVVYRGSHFEVSDSTDLVVQDELETFEINIMSRTRKGQYGVYQAIEYVRSKLLGFKSPSGYFDRLSLKDNAMLSWEDGIWQWAPIFGGSTRITQDEDYDPTPNIKRIDALGNYNTTSVPDETLTD